LLRRGLDAIRHPVSQNALALHVVQIANLIVPLVTLPYVSRVLGADGFGLVAFAQGLSFLLGLLIGWGFDLWGSREVAVTREDRERLSVLVGRVVGARLLLSAGALVIAVIVYATSATTRGSPEFVAMAWLAAASTGLTPSWFFLGLERLRLISTAALAFRALAAALTFVLVKDPGDAWIVMALFSGSAVLTAVFSVVLLFRNVDVVRPIMRPTLSAIREATPLFAGTAGLTLYTAMNVVLLGFLGTRSEVAFFGAAEKVIRASIQLLQPITAAVYPRVTFLDSFGNPGRARRLLFTGAAVAITLALVGAAVALLFAPEIVTVIFGSEFEQSAGVLRVMAPIIPISTVSMVAATWLMVRRKDATLMQITLAGGLLNVALAPVLVHLAGIEGMAASVLCAELVVMTLSIAATAGRRTRRGRGRAAGEAGAETVRG
jgi:PST family polysaccharide transporter